MNPGHRIDTDPAHDVPEDQERLGLAEFALRHAISKNLTQVAASLTFTSVLGIVPLLAVILALFTAFPLFDDFRLALEEFLAANLMPPAVSANVMAYLNLFAAKASGLTAAGTLALVVTSIMLLRTIDEALNAIWQVERQRPLGQRILVYWAILSLGPVLIGASLWASSVLAQQSASVLEHVPLATTLTLTLLPLAASVLGFTGLFMAVPNCRVRWRDALAGGLFSAVALLLMRTGFAYYLSRFPSYTIIYGAFAILPIFLLWIYLSWLAVLSGATIAATLPALREHRRGAPPYPGDGLVHAMLTLHQLWQGQGQVPPGQTVRDIATRTGLSASQALAALQRLHALGYAAADDNKRESRWLLSCDPRTARLRPLVQALLLDLEQMPPADLPDLQRALAVVLADGDVRLEQLFDNPDALPTAPDSAWDCHAAPAEPSEKLPLSESARMGQNDRTR